MGTTQRLVKAFIPLLLHCAVSLTNVGLIESRRNGIVYYVRGLNGANPFSYGAGPGGSISLSPSTTAPLAAAYADDLEKLSVSTLAGKQNAVHVTDSKGAVANRGAGRLDDVSGSSVGFLSSINKPGGLSKKTIHLGVGSTPKEVFSAGTESTLLKSKGGYASSVSSITSSGPVKGSSESPSGVGTANVLEKLPGTSLSSHRLKAPTSNTDSDKAPVSSRIPTLISEKAPSGNVKSRHKATVNLRREATVNGDLPAPQVGSTTIGSPGYLGASDSSGPAETVGTLNGHDGFNREPAIEGPMPTNSMNRPPGLPSRHDTSIHGNESSGSVVGNTVSPSAGRAGISSPVPGHTAAATLPLEGGALSLSKAEPSESLFVDKTKTQTHKNDHNGLVPTGNTKNGLSLGISESPASLGPLISPLPGQFPDVVNKSGVVGTVALGQTNSKHASESPENVHVGNSGIHLGKTSSHTFSDLVKKLQNITTGTTGSTSSAVGLITSVGSVKNEQGKHGILETPLEKTSGISNGRASEGPHDSSGSISIHKSNPPDIIIHPVIPPSEGSRISYPSASLGKKATLAIAKAGGAIPEKPSLASKPVSGSVSSEIMGQKPEYKSEHGSFGYGNRPSGLNAHASLPPLALSVSVKPDLGRPGTFQFSGSRGGLGQLSSMHERAKGTEGLADATTKQQIRNNRAYGSFMDTSLPSGFSISSTGLPTGSGSHIFHSAKPLGYTRFGTIGVASNNVEPPRSRELRGHAGAFQDSRPRTPVHNSRQYASPTIGIRPPGLARGTSELSSAMKAYHPFVQVQTSPSTGNVETVGRLTNVPSLSHPSRLSQKTGAYGSFVYTSLPSGFSISSTGIPTGPGSKIFRASAHIGGAPTSGITAASAAISSTGAPIGAASNVVRTAERFGGSATIAVNRAAGTSGQPSFPQEAGVRTIGFPSSSTTAQLETSGQYGAHTLGTQIPGYGSGIIQTSAASKVPHPSASIQSSSSVNAGALGPLTMVPGLISLPQYARRKEAVESFIPKTPISGFTISSTGPPVRAGFNIYRPHERLGGSLGPGIFAASVAPSRPPRSREVSGVRALTASSAGTNFENRGPYLPPTEGRQTPGLAGGISRSSPYLKTSDPFERMQATRNSENTAFSRLLSNVPDLSNQPQSSQSNGVYDSLIYNSPQPGFSISNSRTPVGMRFRTFRSTKHLQGSAAPGIIEGSGTFGWPLLRGEVRQHLGDISTGNTRQSEGARHFQSQWLGKQPYVFTAGISHPPVNFNGNSNSRNTGAVGPFTGVNGPNEASQPTEGSVGGQPSSSPAGYNNLPGRAGLTDFGFMRSANVAGNPVFKAPADMKNFVSSEFPRATRMLKLQSPLAGTGKPDRHFRTISDRRKPQRMQFGSRAMDGSRYSRGYNSRFTVSNPTLPIMAVPKITDLSKPVGGSAGSPFTLNGVANERPTNPRYVSAFNGGFNVDSRKTEPEVNSAYKYFPRTIISSSETRKADSGEPERRIDFTNFEIGGRPLKWLSNQRGAPVHEGFTANGWETPSRDSSGNEASTTRSSATVNGIGDSTYKPDYSSASEIVGTRRRFLKMPRFEQGTKPSGSFPAAGGVAYPGNTGGYSLHVPETLPSSFNTGYTGPARKAGSRTYNPIRHFGDIDGDEMNRAINDLRRQSASAKTPQFDRGYLSVFRGQPKVTNEYEFIPYNRHSRNIIPYTNSPSDRASTLFDAANSLNDNTGSRNIEAGGGWKAGLAEAPISSRSFTLGSTSDILPGTGSYSPPTVGRGHSVRIGGSDGSATAETTMNPILDGRLRGSMSSYPSKYQSSEGPWVPYFRKDNSGNRFVANIDGFVGGRDGGRGSTDDARFLVPTGYRAIPAGPGTNSGYTTNNPLYRFDGPYGYLSRSTSRRHSSGHSATNDNSGNKGYPPIFLPRAASDSSVSSQDNSAWNPRGAWQGISSYPVSASN